uniref:Uncharacterized protein n=1 Tax=Strigamia maritima TaxID=126957 RepID=T1JA90_STRMM
MGSPNVTPDLILEATTCEGVCTTVKTPQEIREEYFKTYDVMTGLRIAATLGGMILVFGLFLLYKTKCKPRHYEKKIVTVAEAIEYKVEGVNNVKDSSGFHSYAHFQVRCSDMSVREEEDNDNDNLACANQAHLSVMEDIAYMDNNCGNDEIRIQIRTATPCEASRNNIFTWDYEEGACGGVACSISAEPMCVLVPNHLKELRGADTSETKC